MSTLTRRKVRGSFGSIFWPLLCLAFVLISCSPNEDKGAVQPGELGSESSEASSEALGRSELSSAASSYLASLSLPAKPTEALLQSEPETLVGWFRDLEVWTDAVLMLPARIATDERPAVVTESDRKGTKAVLETFFTAKQAERLLSIFWVQDETTGNGYRLLETEGMGLLPFMDHIELKSANRERVVIHAETSSPALWESGDREYVLSWSDEHEGFRVDDILYREQAGSETSNDIPPIGNEMVSLSASASLRWQLHTLTWVPNYFQADGWKDLETVWGRTGNNPILVTVDAPEYRALNQDAWTAVHEPGGNRMAWINEQGVWIGTLGGVPKLLLDASDDAVAAFGNGVPSRLLWSPDGSCLLVEWVLEWDAQYVAVQVDSGKVTELNTRLDGYFLTEATHWLDSQRVLFITRASRSLQGAQEYGSGYRGDLAVLDVQSGTFEKVTAVDDGVFLRPFAVAGGQVWLGEGSKGASFEQIALYHTEGWTRKVLTLPEAQIISVAPESGLIAGLRQVDREGQQDSRRPLYELWLGSSTGKSEEFMGGNAKVVGLVQGENLRLLWSPDGRRLLIGGTLDLPLPDMPDSFRTIYVTQVLEPVTR